MMVAEVWVMVVWESEMSCGSVVSVMAVAVVGRSLVETMVAICNIWESKWSFGSMMSVVSVISVVDGSFADNMMSKSIWGIPKVVTISIMLAISMVGSEMSIMSGDSSIKVKIWSSSSGSCLIFIDSKEFGFSSCYLRCILNWLRCLSLMDSMVSKTITKMSVSIRIPVVGISVMVSSQVSVSFSSLDSEEVSFSSCYFRCILNCRSLVDSISVVSISEVGISVVAISVMVSS